MNCTDFEQLLAAQLLADPLSPAAALRDAGPLPAAAEEHRLHCSVCAERWAAELAVETAIQIWRAQPVEFELPADRVAMLVAEASNHLQLSRSLRPSPTLADSLASSRSDHREQLSQRTRLLRGVGSMAVVAACLFLGAVGLFPGWLMPGAPPMVAQREPATDSSAASGARAVGVQNEAPLTEWQDAITAWSRRSAVDDASGIEMHKTAAGGPGQTEASEDPLIISGRIANLSRWMPPLEPLLTSSSPSSESPSASPTSAAELTDAAEPLVRETWGTVRAGTTQLGQQLTEAFGFLQVFLPDDHSAG